MAQHQDQDYEGKEDHFMDVDRMVNEGLGGGNVTEDNGYIGDSTTDTMLQHDSVVNRLKDREQTNQMDRTDHAEEQ